MTIGILVGRSDVDPDTSCTMFLFLKLVIIVFIGVYFRINNVFKLEVVDRMVLIV